MLDKECGEHSFATRRVLGAHPPVRLSSIHMRQIRSFQTRCLVMT